MSTPDTAVDTAATTTTPPALTPVRVLPHPELCPEGLSFEAKRGRKLIDALLEQGIALEHACEKVCACATCHVYIREGAAALAPADEEEEDQLDDAWGLQADSRLSCCVRVKGEGLVVEIPRYTKNHARER